MANNTVIRSAERGAIPGQAVSWKERFLRLQRRTHIINYLILIPIALIMLVPFLWMLSTSFKPPAETISLVPKLLPNSPTINNYVNAFSRANIGRLYLNTSFLAVVQTILAIYTSALLGFVFAKYRFWGRDVIFVILLSTMIIPFEVYMIPLYVMMVQAKLGNTYMAIILPSIFSAYAMFLFRQFMHSIPNDLLDAARIDGAGDFYVFHQIVVPLSIPVLATLTSFYFMWNWNEFLWPLIVITESEKYVLPVGLATFVSDVRNEFGLMMAAASLAIIPVLVVFVAAQRYIIEGIAITGLKG